jgi:hypothetical protein
MTIALANSRQCYLSTMLSLDNVISRLAKNGFVHFLIESNNQSLTFT